VSELIWIAVLLLAAYAIGSANERAHFKSIRRREEQTRAFPVVTFKRLPPDWVAERGGLVTGSVVVSLDYFKRFLATLRGIAGGRVTAYESLLDRARREAVLRLKDEAMRLGYDAVFNVRLETSRLASARPDGKGTAGVELLAYGTGIKRAAFLPAPVSVPTADTAPQVG
jgi:uncharacterized protein YbjQ (UPF0145 family)